MTQGKTQPRRKIQGPDHWVLSVDEDYAEQIMDAICRGVVIEGQWNHSSLRELRGTRFTDPRTGETRYAVEEWIGPRVKCTVDYAELARAEGHLARAKPRLGV